ncbi:TPA: helix-turn-helix domain-containing protein [Staphylococcus aureus]|uniref:helix-turn-helix domain-containing protein n=1 Tax=Staphylococcus TaxID=1279 RepID=UPI000F5C9086|nr:MULTISPECIES: helix-turn-helix transcriptional regulator [Staphylococcus]QIY36012.1 helix-turn-helix transcriptional regulator [Staphylococcus hominis]RQX43332.1 XRE family transcriptional regulator [Staphylococcus capitis]
MNKFEAKRLQYYICNEMKFIRKNKKLSQEEVAYALNITPSYLSRIENGKFSNTPLFLFIQIADYYNVPLEKIITVATKKKEIDDEYIT